jgi:hypothetical protein
LEGGVNTILLVKSLASSAARGTGLKFSRLFSISIGEAVMEMANKQRKRALSTPKDLILSEVREAREMERPLDLICGKMRF